MASMSRASNLKRSADCAAGLKYPTISNGSARRHLRKSKSVFVANDYVQPYVEQGRSGIERQLVKNLEFGRRLSLLPRIAFDAHA